MWRVAGQISLTFTESHSFSSPFDSPLCRSVWGKTRRLTASFGWAAGRRKAWSLWSVFWKYDGSVPLPVPQLNNAMEEHSGELSQHLSDKQPPISTPTKNGCRWAAAVEENPLFCFWLQKIKVTTWRSFFRGALLVAQLLFVRNTHKRCVAIKTEKELWLPQKPFPPISCSRTRTILRWCQGKAQRLFRPNCLHLIVCREKSQ